MSDEARYLIYEALFVIGFIVSLLIILGLFVLVRKWEESKIFKAEREKLDKLREEVEK